MNGFNSRFPFLRWAEDDNVNDTSQAKERVGHITRVSTGKAFSAFYKFLVEELSAVVCFRGVAMPSHRSRGCSRPERDQN